MLPRESVTALTYRSATPVKLVPYRRSATHSVPGCFMTKDVLFDPTGRIISRTASFPGETGAGIRVSPVMSRGITVLPHYNFPWLMP
jgi:hypothetical protein